MPTAKRSTSEKYRLPLAPDAPPRPRLPPWIKARLPSGDNFFAVQQLVRAQGLHTVCESASCPNIGECWDRRALTIMILGGVCTRSCQFCDVPTGRPEPGRRRRAAPRGAGAAAARAAPHRHHLGRS
jgi:lipoic acid synthetase